MKDKIAKDHTEAYLFLKATALSLQGDMAQLTALSGRDSEYLASAVLRNCARLWDAKLSEAVQMFPPNDVRAAITRLKEGKRLLGFLEKKTLKESRVNAD